MRIELLDSEIFYSIKEAEILIDQWRIEHNRVRPHRALGDHLPAPMAALELSCQFQPFERSMRVAHVTRPGGPGGPGGEKVEYMLILKGLIEAGVIIPFIDLVYPFNQILEEHCYVETGHKKGNVVIPVPTP